MRFVEDADKSSVVARMIAPLLTAMGYEVVRVQLTGRQKPLLQIMAERIDRRGMTLKDCSEVSRAVSAVLDVEDPIAQSYTLEVSSPGMDRPLTRPEDFARFAGSQARIETRQPINGRRRFRGRLLGLEGEFVRIAASDGEFAIAISDVQKARLVISDDLFAGRPRAATDG